MSAKPTSATARVLKANPDLARELFFPGSDFDAAKRELDDALKIKRTTRRRSIPIELEMAAKGLNRWFTRKAPSGNIVFPSAREISHLDRMFDSAVVEAAAKLRAREPWERFDALDRHYPKLRLRRRISAAIARLGAHVPPRPLETIMRLKSEPGTIGRQAARFLDVTLQVRTAERDAASISWDEFHDLLLRYRNDDRKRNGHRPLLVLEPLVRDVPGSQPLIAYTVYLEIELEDRRWWRRYGEGVERFRSWIENELAEITLVRELEKALVPLVSSAELEESREKDRLKTSRAAATARKRKQRAKKSSAKSVT